MNETIWKYDLKVNDITHLYSPKDSEILCVQIQNGEPCIWVKVNPEATKELRSFIIIGTGHEIDVIPKKYIGTFQLYDGSFVGHLFELIKS